MDGPRLLTVKHVAAELGVHPETVRRWIRAKRVRAVSFGSDRAGLRVPRAELERLSTEGLPPAE